MIDYRIKTLTLNDFDKLENQGFGDLLDPLFFTHKYRDGLAMAKITYEVAIFDGEKPTREAFLDSIQGVDFDAIRERLFRAYRDFFPPRVQRGLDAWKDDLHSSLRNFLTQELAEVEVVVGGNGR